MRTNLSLLPQILSLPNVGLMLKERRDWFISTSLYPIEEVQRLWEDPLSSLLLERSTFKGHLSDFYHVSKTLPFYLSKTEVEDRRYYMDLYSAMRVLPTRTGLPAVIMGPTYGAEVEVCMATGATPYVVGMRSSPWYRQMIEASFEKGLEFEDGIENPPPREPPVVILSRVSPDPSRDVRIAYEMLWDVGYIVFPSRTISMTGESERIGLKKILTSLSQVSVYFKSPITEKTDARE